MKKRNFLVLTLSVILLSLVFIEITAASPYEIYNVPVGNSYIRGPNNAMVTIVMFSDFQCPFCKRVEDTLSDLMQEFRGQLRIVWKHHPLPFHPNANILSLATEAAGAQGKFWEMHDLIFQNQERFSQNPNVVQSLEELARKINLNVSQFRNSIDTKQFQSKIDVDVQLAQILNSTGTPCFYINGRILSGAQPIDVFRQAINEELQKANNLVSKGISRDKIYEETVKNGLKTQGNQIQIPQNSKVKIDDPDTIYKININNSPFRGSKNAPVTIVLFGDFDCPYSAKIEETFSKILNAYNDKVRIVWKHYPLSDPGRLSKALHPNADIAAEASESAKAQGKFWEMHDLLLWNQLDRRTVAGTAQDQDEKTYTDWIINNAVKIPGLNIKKLKTDLIKHTYKARVDSDKTIAKNLHVVGTPTCFINGKRSFGGAASFDAFKTVIDQELNDAELLMKAKKIKSGQVYSELMKKGITKDALANNDNFENSAKVNIPPQPDGPAKGPIKSKVRVVIFSDFQCPFCSEAANLINSVANHYGNKIRVEFLQYPLPFHQWASLAAEASLAAHAQKNFWKLHDAIFRNQDELRYIASENEVIDFMINLAKQIPSINTIKMRQDLTLHINKAKVDENIAIGNSIGVKGTPTIYINGVEFEGERTLEGFKSVIDPLLKAKVKKAQ